MAQSSVLLPRVGALGVRPLQEGVDQALLPQIEGTTAARSLWADAAATTINVGGGAANATVNVGAGAAVSAIQLGAASTTVTIPGNLTIQGTTTTVSTTNLTVSDALIYANNGGLDPSFAGIAWDQGAALDVVHVWNPTNSRIEFGRFNTSGGTTAPASALTTLADVRINNLTLAGTSVTADAALAVTATAAALTLAATGANAVQLSTNSTPRWNVNSGGNLVANTDGGPSLGTAGANRPGAVFVNTLIEVGNEAATGTMQAPGASTAATAGGSITVQAGAGNTSGVGGSARLLAGDGGATGAGGPVVISGGTATDGNGGSGELHGGAGAGTNRSGGAATLRAGDSTGTVAGALATLLAGSNTGAGIGGQARVAGGNSGTGGGGGGGPVSIEGGVGDGAGPGGEVLVLGGVPGTSGTGGGVSLRGADGGAGGFGNGGSALVESGSAISGVNQFGGLVSIKSGAGFGAGGGGNLVHTAGNGGATGAGGNIQITAGNGGATSGNAGSVNISGGSLVSGVGGSVTITATPGTTAGEFTVTVGGSSTPWSESGSRSLAGFTATSVVGALNELASSGSTTTFTNGNGTTVTQGQVCYLTTTANTVALGDATADAAAAQAFYFVVDASIANAATGSFVLGGPVIARFDPSLTLTPGDEVFLSEVTPGSITNVAPSTGGNVVQSLGYLRDTLTYDGTTDFLARIQFVPGSKSVV